MSSINDSWVELICIHHLNSVNKPLCIHSSLCRSVINICSLPSRMIMHHQCILRLGISHSLNRIRIINQIIVCCE